MRGLGFSGVGHLALHQAWVSGLVSESVHMPEAKGIGGVIFQVHTRLYHSTLGSRVIKKKKKKLSSLWMAASACSLCVRFRVFAPGFRFRAL